MVQRITINPSQLSIEAASLKLEAAQSHYLTRVLRLKAGDRFIAQDGLGNQWLAAIAGSAGYAHLLERLPAIPATSEIRLIAALPKGNSFDAVIRQTTELGVTHIHPVTTARTLLKPSVNKVDRWKRIAKEASEQSERVTIPVIAAPVSFPVCLASLKQERNSHPSTLQFICAARANLPEVERRDFLSNNHLLARLFLHQQRLKSSENIPSVIIAIGPEGGWTTDEITVATTYNYEIVSLGSVILRAVTAPVTALSLVTAARELLI